MGLHVLRVLKADSLCHCILGSRSPDGTLCTPLGDSRPLLVRDAAAKREGSVAREFNASFHFHAAASSREGDMSLRTGEGNLYGELVGVGDVELLLLLLDASGVFEKLPMLRSVVTTAPWPTEFSHVSVHGEKCGRAVGDDASSASSSKVDSKFRSREFSACIFVMMRSRSCEAPSPAALHPASDLTTGSSPLKVSS
jgi:hypothetical protein